MENCWFSRRSKQNLLIAFGGCLLLSATMDVLAAYALSKTEVPSAILLALFSCCYIGLAGMVYVNYTYKYSIDSQGITVYSITGKKCTYLWSKVEHIIVCDIDHSTRLNDVFTVAIRITLANEKGGPFDDYQPLDLSGIERWRSRGCYFLRYSKAIILDYSDERLKKIISASGKIVYDFLSPRTRKRGWYEDENGKHQFLSGDGLHKP